MYIGDIQLQGKLYGTPQPQWGLHHNIAIQDRKLGPSITAYAPLGDLHLSPDSGPGQMVMGDGISLAYLVPTDRSIAEVMTRAMLAIQQIEADFGLELYNIKDQWQGKGLRNTVMPHFNENKWVAFQDTDSVYLMCTTETYMRQMLRIQEWIDETYMSVTYRPKPIGMGFIQFDAEAKKFKTFHPHTQVKFGKNTMECLIPSMDLSHSRAREVGKYQNIAGAAWQRVYDAWNDSAGMKRTPNLSAEDHIATATTHIAVYHGLNGEPPQTRLYDAQDLYDRALSGMGKGPSKAYNTMQIWPANVDPIKVRNRISSWLTYNMVMGVVGERVKARALPVQYIAIDGSIFKMRKALPFYCNPSVDFGKGGGTMPWMHPASNRPMDNSIAWPMEMRRDGHDEWLWNTKATESYSDLQIDRGEIASDQLIQEVDAMHRLVPTRDTRIYTVRQWDREFIIIKVPNTNPNKMPGLRIASGIELGVTYWSDPVSGLGKGLNVSATFLEPEVPIVRMLYGRMKKEGGWLMEAVSVEKNVKLVELNKNLYETTEIRAVKKEGKQPTVKLMPGGIGPEEKNPLGEPTHQLPEEKPVEQEPAPGAKDKGSMGKQAPPEGPAVEMEG